MDTVLLRPNFKEDIFEVMQLEVGEVIEGKVTGITKFGAFIELPGGKTGMVHISEVAATYVKEIKDHVSLDQMVKVKVLAISEEGKISLSIKRAVEPKQQPAQQNGPRQGGYQRRQSAPRPANNGPASPAGYEWTPRSRSSENMSFEDMMAKFKQSSDDKMSDLKKYMDVKHGTGGRRGSTR